MARRPSGLRQVTKDAGTLAVYRGAMLCFDGHNDMLGRLWERGDPEGRAFLESDETGHIDLARARTGGFSGGLFALFAPSEGFELALAKAGVPPEEPGMAEPDAGLRAVLAQAAILHRMARAESSAIRICRSAGEVEAAGDAVAAVLHLEGAEPLGPDLAELPALHALGLRSIGPVWSRPNAFGHGVPFRFPSDPDTGPGLTEAGAALVAACEEWGILLDAAHVNDAGLRDLARLATRPFVSSHAGAHAICPASRNHTDAQLRLIAEAGGLVGLVLNTDFVRRDGRADPDTPLDAFVDHLDHMIAVMGEEGVGLGSDFDGGPVARDLPDCAAMPRLIVAMERRGHAPDRIERICRGNWLRVLRDTIG